FLYLVTIIDWASRAVLAWRLSNTNDASFCAAALEEALLRFGKPRIFNTDRRRRFARGARNCNFVRNNPTLGESFRADHSGGIAQAPSQTAFDLASGRGLSENRWA